MAAAFSTSRFCCFLFCTWSPVKLTTDQVQYCCCVVWKRFLSFWDRRRLQMYVCKYLLLEYIYFLRAGGSSIVLPMINDPMVDYWRTWTNISSSCWAALLPRLALPYMLYLLYMEQMKMNIDGALFLYISLSFTFTFACSHLQWHDIVQQLLCRQPGGGSFCQSIYGCCVEQLFCTDLLYKNTFLPAWRAQRAPAWQKARRQARRRKHGAAHGGGRGALRAPCCTCARCCWKWARCVLPAAMADSWRAGDSSGRSFISGLCWMVHGTLWSTVIEPDDMICAGLYPVYVYCVSDKNAVGGICTLLRVGAVHLERFFSDVIFDLLNDHLHYLCTSFILLSFCCPLLLFYKSFARARAPSSRSTWWSLKIGDWFFL